MPDKTNWYLFVRRFLAVAQRILGLVLLALEIWRRWHNLLK